MMMFLPLILRKWFIATPLDNLSRERPYGHVLHPYAIITILSQVSSLLASVAVCVPVPIPVLVPALASVPVLVPIPVLFVFICTYTCIYVSIMCCFLVIRSLKH